MTDHNEDDHNEDQEPSNDEKPEDPGPSDDSEATVPDPVEILNKDLRNAAATMTPQEARYLVDYYYLNQESRKGVDNQIRSMKGEPHSLLLWVTKQTHRLEAGVQRALGVYSRGQIVGRWAESNVGIGPVLSAGLLAHIDIEKALAVGHIWNFAGLNPGIKWLGKEGSRKLMAEVSEIPHDADPGDYDDYALAPEEVAVYEEIVTASTGRRDLTRIQLGAIARLTNRKIGNLLRLACDDKGHVTPASMTALLAKRPWNASLKTLCWKVGESFSKQSANPDCYYGALWMERREMEIQRNEAGEFVQQAEDALKAKKYGRDTSAFKWYSGRVTQRAAMEYRLAVVAERARVKSINEQYRQVGDTKREVERVITPDLVEVGEGLPMLPPAHIHARAKRWVVKLFLSHWHQVAYEVHYGVKPPAPYAIEHLGHVHLMEPPNWPME